LRRREFITHIGGAAAWPLAVRAQQSAMPVIGFLDSRTPEAVAGRLRAFRQGLKETGYIEGENVAIIYRWAENQVDRLPELASDLVERHVAVIVTPGEPAALAAKTATATIPIAFIMADDPVKAGLVTSLARPGGNATGISFLAAELEAKRLQLFREVVPGASRIVVLVNPAETRRSESRIRAVEAAARTMTLEVQVLKAGTSREIEDAFGSIDRTRPGGLFVETSPFLAVRNVQLAILSAFHRLPATHSEREFVEAGGLMSYGSNIMDAYRQQGAYVGRILKGSKPADLPVVQSSKLGWSSMLGPPGCSALPCRPRCFRLPTTSSNKGLPCCDCSRPEVALRSYAENDAQRPLLEVKADSHVAVRQCGLLTHRRHWPCTAAMVFSPYPGSCFSGYYPVS
jgi:putative tryptophan/tyrosine transport system substrate-binding protein